MNEGKIKNISEKGFGFIETTEGGDLFFHSSEFDGQFDELKRGQPVKFNIGEGRQGPRAENVQLAD